MDKRFIPHEHEKKLYEWWEQKGLFRAPQEGTPYTILMPPPNANASLHAGHGMYTIDDILIRYQRMQGYSALWIPGLDHAGFETQFVYEKHLAKQKKSRMDFDRKTLYNNIEQFVRDNSGLIYQQFRRLGFLADWQRSVFTLDPQVLKRVFETFKKMESEGLVYRDEYIVNYCTHCGTSLAELEVKHIERTDPLYYIKYGPFTLATVRPETKFGDTAIAVHPRDKRYVQWIGKEVEVEGLLGTLSLPVVADEFVDPTFGTGAVKVTPAHDPNDFEIGKRHRLAVKKAIGLDGRLTALAGPYAGLKIKAARESVAAELEKRGLLDKVDTHYTHSVTVCYKCNRDLEPSILPNWFIKVAQLKKPVIEAVRQDRVKFHPKKYKKHILQWLRVMHDWPISRQIAWGIRIPVWYRVNKKSAPYIFVSWLDKDKTLQQGTLDTFLQKNISLELIEEGLQQVYAATGKNAPAYVIASKKPHDEYQYIPETDTFDTWFSSGQWPLVTLRDEEYQTRFPTDTLATLSDILNFWVSRMMMFSLYTRQEVPFKNVYLWSMVADAKGKKMSKSKGNVINPIELVDKYGADAFRAALVFGVSQGGVVALSEDKVRAMRNFANKIWNIGRFMRMGKEAIDQRDSKKLSAVIALKKEFNALEKSYHKHMSSYQFSLAFTELYEFVWHRLADYYIEALKDEIKNGTISVVEALLETYQKALRLLHPFMPFVTEAVYKILNDEEASIIS